MKINRISLAVLALFTGLSVTATQVESVDQLHRNALDRLQQFAIAYPDSQAAGHARDILKKESESPDPYRWIGETMRFSIKAFQECPPNSGNKEFRQAAQEILDCPLSIENTDPKMPKEFNRDWKKAVDSVYQPILNRMLDEIAAAKIESGAKVWKVYNMGFVVKTHTHTFAFDLFPGSTNKKFTPEQLEKLTGMLDALFISHNHGDHYNAGLAEAMLKAKKPVIRATEKILTKFSTYPNLLTLFHTKKPEEVAGLSIRAFPGIQDITELCAIYMVTVDGVSVTHNGDNQSVNPYRMMREYAPVDIALTNCWSGFSPYLFAVKPKLAIIGHEHELNHKVATRNSFAMVYHWLEEDPPAGEILVMDCGESVSFPFKQQQKTSNL